MIFIKKNGQIVRADGKDAKEIVVVVSEERDPEIITGKYVPVLTAEQLASAYNFMVGGKLVVVASENDEYFVIKEAHSNNDKATIYFDFEETHILKYELDDEEVVISATKLGEGNVLSVNGKVGVVVLTAEDIKLSDGDVRSIKQSLDFAFEEIERVEQEIPDTSNFEQTSNKTTTLTSSSTDTQYPSAKAVFDGLQDVREVAEGKSKLFVLSYNEVFNPSYASSNRYIDKDGNRMSLEECEEFIEGKTNVNSRFNSQDDSVLIPQTYDNYLILEDYLSPTGARLVLIRTTDFVNLLKKGDVILVIETDVPDRWHADSGFFYKLETSKIDLTNYAKKNEANTFAAEQTFIEKLQLKNSLATSIWDLIVDSGGTFYLRRNGTVMGYFGVNSLHLLDNNLSLEGDLTNGTDSVSVSDIANGTFNVINASDIVSNTLTQAQYDLITNGKPTLIKGTYQNRKQIIVYPFSGLIAGTILRAKYSAIDTSNNMIEGTIRLNSNTKALTISDTQYDVILNGIGQINGKTIPANPTTDAELVHYNGNYAWLDNAPVVDTTHTTFSGGLYSNKEYKFTQPLTSLTIASLDITPNDNNPIWSIMFQAETGFALTTSGLRIQWKDEIPPTFENSHIYQIMFKYVELGEVDFYLGICVDMGGYQG